MAKDKMKLDERTLAAAALGYYSSMAMTYLEDKDSFRPFKGLSSRDTHWYAHIGFSVDIDKEPWKQHKYRYILRVFFHEDLLGRFTYRLTLTKEVSDGFGSDRVSIEDKILFTSKEVKLDEIIDVSEVGRLLRHLAVLVASYICHKGGERSRYEDLLSEDTRRACLDLRDFASSLWEGDTQGFESAILLDTLREHHGAAGLISKEGKLLNYENRRYESLPIEWEKIQIFLQERESISCY